MASIEVSGTKNISDYSHNSFASTGSSGFTKFLDARLAPQIAQEGSGVAKVVREGSGVTKVVREGSGETKVVREGSSETRVVREGVGTNKVARLSDIPSVGAGDITNSDMGWLMRIAQSRRNFAYPYNPSLVELSKYQGSWRSLGVFMDVDKHKNQLGNNKLIVSCLVVGDYVETSGTVEIRIPYSAYGSMTAITATLPTIKNESATSYRLHAVTSALPPTSQISDFGSGYIEASMTGGTANSFSIGYVHIEVVPGRVDSAYVTPSQYCPAYEAFNGSNGLPNLPSINTLVSPW